jgi:hypothetical protein
MSRTWPRLTIRFSARKSPVDVWWMIGFMPAVGELVRCTDGSWMTRPAMVVSAPEMLCALAAAGVPHDRLDGRGRT